MVSVIDCRVLCCEVHNVGCLSSSEAGAILNNVMLVTINASISSLFSMASPTLELQPACPAPPQFSTQSFCWEKDSLATLIWWLELLSFCHLAAPPTPQLHLFWTLTIDLLENLFVLINLYVETGKITVCISDFIHCFFCKGRRT